MAVAASERRAYPRLHLSWKAGAGTVDGIDLLSSRTQNVSLAGVCIRGPLNAGVGEEIVLQLSVQHRTIPAMARVVATRPIGDEFELRLHFSWMSSGSREALSRWAPQPLSDN